MIIEGKYIFDAPLLAVWNHLQSPDAIAGCIPGCDRFEPAGENQFNVEMNVKVAAIRGKYSGTVAVSDISYLETYTMTVTGRGTGGNIKATGILNFTAVDNHTEVSVSGEAQVTGLIARVGQRIMSGASRMLMNQFFTCMKSHIEPDTNLLTNDDQELE